MSIKAAAVLKAYFETGKKPTQAQFEDLIDTLFNGLSAKPKIYRALISQSGTDAPVATVLENTLGGTLEWSRDSQGIFIATLEGAFTESEKVWIDIGNNANNHGDDIVAIVDSENTLALATASFSEGSWTNNDGVLVSASIEILIYP